MLRTWLTTRLVCSEKAIKTRNRLMFFCRRSLLLGLSLLHYG